MKLNELIGSDDAGSPIGKLQRLIGQGTTIPNLLLVGAPGLGKTTAAHAIAESLNAEAHEFNASDERGIEVIRTQVKGLATQRGWADTRVIILDEADGLTRQAQDALRRIMETGDALFILTANEAASLIPAIKSRCHTIHFRPYTTTEVLSFCNARGCALAGDEASALAGAFNGDLRLIGNALDATTSTSDLLHIAAAHAANHSKPALSLVESDWVSLHRELMNMIVNGTTRLQALRLLQRNARDLDMEPERYFHFSRVWGDAVLACHQWPLDDEGFVDWFVGTLSSTA